jgi:membrane associated rhomboid family serine protease
MHQVHSPIGEYTNCPEGHGQALFGASLHSVMATPKFRVLKKAFLPPFGPSRFHCPKCAKAMNTQTVHGIEVDICSECPLIWLDMGELEAVAADAVSELEERDPQAALAVAQIQLMRENQKVVDEYSEESGSLSAGLLGYAGIPILQSRRLQRSSFAVTGLVVAVCTWLLVASLFLPNLTLDLAFYPAYILKNFGLNAFTSFFAHDGIVHLLGNMLGLLIFGPAVEGFLGARRFVLLLLVGHLVGLIIYSLFALHGTPVVGASSAVVAVMVFLIRLDPAARMPLPTIIRLYWVPAWFWLVIYLGSQLKGALYQVMGMSNVASTGHLGGALAGLVLFSLWVKPKPAPDK